MILTSQQNKIPSLPDSKSINIDELPPLKEMLSSVLQRADPDLKAASILWHNKEKKECLLQTTTNSVYYAEDIDEKPRLTKLDEAYSGTRHWSLNTKKGDFDTVPYFQILLINDELIVSKESHPRHYEATCLPTLVNAKRKNIGVAEPQDQTLLLKLYDQICSQYRALADTRFKLLGLLPAASVIAWTQLFKDEITKRPFVGLAIALLGLVVSIGIQIYDQRNNALYNDLISRGRKIEEELGVQTGMFRGRCKPNSEVINHGIGIGLIYWSVLFGWVVFVFWFAFQV